jgi:hypothetical protein
VGAWERCSVGALQCWNVEAEKCEQGTGRGNVSDWIFETKDYEGTDVVLSKATWHAKAGNDEMGSHPEISDYLVDIQKTIESPDLVYQSTRDIRSRMFYLLNAGRGKLEGKHLVVVVKYVQETENIRGYVSTIYMSRSIYTKGEQLWPNTQQQLP